MVRQLVLGLGLAVGVAMTTGCENKSSAPASGSQPNTGLGSDEYKKAMGANKAPKDADKKDEKKDEKK